MMIRKRASERLNCKVMTSGHPQSLLLWCKLRWTFLNLWMLHLLTHTTMILGTAIVIYRQSNNKMYMYRGSTQSIRCIRCTDNVGFHCICCIGNNAEGLSKHTSAFYLCKRPSHIMPPSGPCVCVLFPESWHRDLVQTSLNPDQGNEKADN